MFNRPEQYLNDFLHWLFREFSHFYQHFFTHLRQQQSNKVVSAIAVIETRTQTQKNN